MLVLYIVLFFFFKQKTAYEMRISDWSSDVCSSDLKAVVSEDVEVVLRADYTHAVYSDVMKIYPRTASFYYTPPNTPTDTTPGPQFFSPDPRKVYFDEIGRAHV